jgi:hypothetical protein
VLGNSLPKICAPMKGLESLAPGLNGTKIRAVLDGMDLNQSLQIILMYLAPFIRPEAAKKA